MNADGSAGVDADISTGANIPFLDELGWSAVGSGAFVLASDRPARRGHPSPAQPDRQRRSRLAPAACEPTASGRDRAAARSSSARGLGLEGGLAQAAVDEKVPIGYFGIRNSYCQRSEPLIVPLRSFLVDDAEVARDLVAVEGRLDLRLELDLAVDEERETIGSAPTKVWPPPWIGMHGDRSAGHEVARPSCCRTSLNVTLWPLLGLADVLDGLGGDGARGDGERTTTAAARSAAVSFFMAAACIVARAITSGISPIRPLIFHATP